MRFYFCPQCQGQSRQNNKKCSFCRGRGIYSLFGGYVLFFRKVFSSHEKIESRGRFFLRIIFKIVFFVFLIWGGACFLKIVSDFFNFSVFPVAVLDFLPINNLDLVCWGAVLLLCYGYFWRSFRRERKIKIWPKSKIIRTKDISSFEEAQEMGKKYKINVYSSLSRPARILVRESWALAHQQGHSFIYPIHLFRAALKDSDVKSVLARLAIDHRRVMEVVDRALKKIKISKEKKSSSSIFSSKGLKKVLLSAYILAGEKRKKNISSLEILEALSVDDDLVREIFYDFEIDFHQIKNVCLWMNFYKDFQSRQSFFAQRSRFKPKGAINKAYTAIATPNLDAYSQDLTQLARNNYLQFCVDREEEKEDIFRIFSTERQSLILVGQPGVGKSTLVGGLARLMVTEEVPPILKDKRLVSLSLARLIAGASQSGEIEARLQAIIQEVTLSGNIVLFIKDIHNMIGVKTTQGEMDASEILANALKSRVFLLIATSIPKEYHRLIEGQSLGDSLQKVEIEEPERNINIQILEAHAAFVESEEKVYFSYRALEKIIDLSERYVHDRFFPEKAVNILKEVAIMVKRTEGKKSIVRSEHVAKLIAQKVKIPLTKLTQEETVNLLDLEERIHQRLIDQTEAVKAVATALRRARTELRNEKRPITNLLFLGPTGVGKTELAKTVAEVYFGDEERMIRIDMSEYQSAASVERLLGSASQNKGGYLTEAVRHNPYSLLLLDEIEKASPDILNLFLQVMEDGRLTDALGRTIDFTNIILIATSNAGSNFIQDSLKKGLSIEEIGEILLKEKLRTSFRPEFLNRFDGLIVFKPLKREEIKQIASLMLKKLEKTLEKKGIGFRASEAAIQELAEAGFDPLFGARPLRRAIQDRVENLIADFLLKGKVGRRDTLVLEKGGNLRVEKASRF
ncbi:ATP-dependent Clp protease ATP-binding subunit [Patescibacteria group bacterium]|nr:ATP-dependent Clp protease ATP-binding subunit [Patescibacteria group bacterium]